MIIGRAGAADFDASAVAISGRRGAVDGVSRKISASAACATLSSASLAAYRRSHRRAWAVILMDKPKRLLLAWRRHRNNRPPVAPGSPRRHRAARADRRPRRPRPRGIVRGAIAASAAPLTAAAASAPLARSCAAGAAAGGVVCGGEIITTGAAGGSCIAHRLWHRMVVAAYSMASRAQHRRGAL